LTRARRAIAYAALALLVACGEDRATPIRAELAKLKKERVPTEQLDTAKREASESEATRDAAVEQVGRDEAQLAADRAELERLRAALQKESDRNADLRAQLQGRTEPLNAATAQSSALETKVAERRKRLGVLRDQAKALAKAMQPQDPAWAEARRLAALRDFDADVAAQLPAEPAVHALSSALDASPPDRLAIVRALQSLAETLDTAAQQGAAPTAAK
jgi:predicted  nucleic acid-binding Zn-ribbon protein